MMMMRDVATLLRFGIYLFGESPALTEKFWVRFD